MVLINFYVQIELGKLLTLTLNKLIIEFQTFAYNIASKVMPS